MKRIPHSDSNLLAVSAARSAADKLGVETLVIDVGDVIGITDFFVITSSNNQRQMQSIREEIEMNLSKESDLKPIRVEGKESEQWVLMDYGVFVVHIFDREWRSFYNLERLWSDQPILDWEKND
ncbi:MAG: ribosome silencing factor [Acidimicrobiales bacterium]|nr:ribosome silencing factor [Acidimicrobiales bacterium]